MNWSPSINSDYTLLTVANAAQSNPIDVSNVTTANPGTSLTTSVTTTQGNDLLLSFPVGSGASPTFTGFGTGETQTITPQTPQFGPSTGSYKNAAATGGSESVTVNTSASQQMDEPVVAIKASAGPAPLATATTSVYAYAQTGFANPDALTSLGNGISTTTYSYDANGNLIQAGGWNYMWDYLNRMLASGYNNSTTTYAYDPSGARVLQTSTTSTTYYPNKYYSFTSTKIGANTYATSTNYIWNGDTLLATVDQRLYNGAATGSPITRFIHPDHLGSTNAVTDENGALVQLLDYYPYGATRVSTSSYPTNEKRQYIDQFTDAQTGLNYFNARFYDGNRGQFLSQDPVFLALGTPQSEALFQQRTAYLLSDPQQLGAYSYSRDNPIVHKDPSGNAFGVDDAAGFFGGGLVGAVSYVGVSAASGNQLTWGGLSGSFLTGGIIGSGLVNTPETLGVSNAVSASVTTGLIGGFYGDALKQGIDIKTGAQKTSYDLTASQVSGLSAAGSGMLTEGLLPNAKIAGVTTGQNSFVAIGKSTATKVANGTISNVSLSTGVKTAVGSQAASLYKTLVGVLVDLVRALSTQEPTQSKK
jgi:RHS repeat-associated protein